MDHLQKEYTKDSHCSYCGSRFAEQILYPRICFRCGNETYKNPIPIVVCMVSVEVDNRMGILIQQRGIDPEKGKWALSSGYIEHGESWEEAAVRENQEEMGIISKPDDYKFYDIKKSATGNMLIFCRTKTVWTDGVTDFIAKFEPNHEVSALDIYYGDTELAFPSHNECAADFIKRLQNTQSPWTY